MTKDEFEKRYNEIFSECKENWHLLQPDALTKLLEECKDDAGIFSPTMAATLFMLKAIDFNALFMKEVLEQIVLPEC